MHKNKKVWVWSATNRKYGYWYKTKKKAGIHMQGLGETFWPAGFQKYTAEAEI